MMVLSESPRPRFLLGVDGGGTGTRARLSTLDGQALGQGQAGPSALGQGCEQSWRHIQQAVAGALGQAGLESVPAAELAVGVGLSGTELADAAQSWMQQQPGYGLLVLESDGHATVLGAHAGRPGVVVASGTGSVAEVLREDGSRQVVGGWGWQCGDEGSGAWLGLRAMQHAQQAMDGRAQARSLALAVWSVAGSTRSQMAQWCAQAGQNGFASLAPLVFEFAATDPVASQLLHEAAQALADMATSLDPQGQLPLALCGSIAQRLQHWLPESLTLRCRAPLGDAADGALILVRAELIQRGVLS